MNITTHKVEFYFGIGLDKHQRVIPPEVRPIKLARIREAALAAFSGCTMVMSEGAWRQGDKTWVEDSRILIVLVDLSWSRTSIRKLAEQIKHIWNQEAVMVTYTPTTGEML